MGTRLNQSKVTFLQDVHKYFLDGTELHGITGVLDRQLFSNKYDGVPEHILTAAAQHGSFVHGICELMDTIGALPNCEEAENYLKIVAENNLKHVASEYLVSDEEYAASSIDKVYEGENKNEYIIADIKITSILDEDYLAWQLGCYKYLFEKQNPDCKVTGCYAIWLRKDKCAYKAIDVKSADECKELIALDKAGEETYGQKYGISYGRKKEEMPADMLGKEQQLRDLLEQKNILEDRIAEIKDEFLACMTKDDASTWKGYSLTVTRKADSKRKDFDKKKFQSEHGDMYEQYIKETTIKGGISVRMA